ncbi:lipoate--protein ligase family protein [Candidatus Bipolaricaulota bacterium]|nr:lipoate--protein ligase family protein [Candidatus Bipolaricaulota bacterium]
MGLAIDEVLLDSVRGGGRGAIRFWVNRHAVVIGRSQSVAEEVDLEAADRAGIPVLRRISGGGAVYHYPGNLNLSVTLSKGAGIASVADVFRTFGEAAATGLAPWADVTCGENALRVGDLKIGGAAQARRGDAVLYHSTLLLAPDETPMSRLLLAHRPGYAPTRLASRPSRTITMAEICDDPVEVPDVIMSLRRAVEERLGVSARPDDLTGEELQRAHELVRDRYGRDAWNRSH